MTMSQQDKERLLRTLQDDPVFLAQIRSLILPAELVQLPERFAQFATHVTRFIERQEEFNADFRAFIQRQEEFNTRTDASIARLEESIARQDQSIARLEEFAVRQEEFNARQATPTPAWRPAYNVSPTTWATSRAMWPAVSPARWPTISPSSWATKSPSSSAVTTCETCCAGPRPMTFRPASGAASTWLTWSRKFKTMTATNCSWPSRHPTPPTNAIPQRAVRNAELISRFTGMTAVAVVASLENDHAVQQLVEDGHVQWFQFQSRDLQPQ